MKNLIPLIVALLLTVGNLRAEQIFVLFDGTCGDRVLYEQTIAQQPQMDYYAYHFGLVGGDRLLLETGAEGATIQNFLPQGYVYCGDPRLSLDLAKRVNGGVDQVYILLPTQNNQYIIQPVVMASTLQRRGATFAYQSPLTGFDFDVDNGIIGENLATAGNPDAKVYFEGRETSSCAGYFLFRQLKVGSSYPVIDYKISPEIGVFERRLGSDGVSTTGGLIVAREVNGIAVASYLKSICAGATAMNNAAGQAAPPAPTVPGYQNNQQSAPQGYANQQSAPTNPYNYAQPESQAYVQANPQAPVTSSTLTHTVARGETLYAVSRRYNTTVDAIKAVNGLNSNTLFPGQQLSVTTTNAVSQPYTAPSGKSRIPNETVATTPTVPTVPYNAGPVATSNPGAAQPTPYGQSPAAPGAYGNQQTSRGQTAVYGEDVHIVQPGETVASVALKYGYTSAKFREINELGPNQIVKVGQQLATTACNCPAAAAPPAPAATQPAAYGQQAPAQPQAYGQPAPAQPQAYGQAPTAPQSPAPAFRTPQGYQAPGAGPQPAATTPRVPAPTTITNNPNFGQPVPNVSAPPSSTMGQLEGQGAPAQRAPATNNPGTYGAYPAPAAPRPQANGAQPRAYGTQPGQPRAYGNQPAGQPYEYTAPRPVPNAYGTPVGANAPQAPAPAPDQVNRAFHLVQEGDSLFSISRRYGLTTDQLRRLNNLDAGGVIVPFQKLYVN